MTTALDSSVLWAIVKKETGYHGWVDCLYAAAQEGNLIVSPVVFAELSPSTPNTKALLTFFDQLGITYSEIIPESAFLAGGTFKRYRMAGGPREHMIPDFLIAAHAQTQAHRLAAVDRGYLRIWFPDLAILNPS